jgi:tRNA U34 5-methylaminomethyl-2-thiouridine-forming methyltransferase MnmC
VGDDRVLTEDGSPTLFSHEYGEHYHNLSGAFLESRERYVIPCRVIERARAGGVRLLDVGFGLGFNLALAWEAVREAAPGATLRIVSLEKAPIAPEHWRSLAAGLLEPIIIEGVADLLERGEHARGAVSLKLWVGRAEDTIERVGERFDGAFLDPFSPDRNPELWTPRFLAAIRRRVDEGAILSTYSAAVRVRVALLRAGWRIGAGPRVGRKSSGTLASAGDVVPPLPPRLPWGERRLERKARESRDDGADDAIS